MGAGLVGAGPARERVAPATRQRLPRRIPETWVLQVSGAPYPRRGAMVVPSGTAQAPQAGPATHHRWAAFGGARSSASQHACLTPVCSLSNVLFSRVPEGQNTDPLRGRFRGPGLSLAPNLSTEVVFVGACLASERVALATRQDPRDAVGAPYRRRGAMVVPSGIAQAVHGRSHLAIPGQIGPSRHHHCPAH